MSFTFNESQIKDIALRIANGTEEEVIQIKAMVERLPNNEEMFERITFELMKLIEQKLFNVADESNHQEHQELDLSAMIAKQKEEKSLKDLIANQIESDDYLSDYFDEDDEYENEDDDEEYYAGDCMCGEHDHSHESYEGNPLAESIRQSLETLEQEKVSTLSQSIQESLKEQEGNNLSSLIKNQITEEDENETMEDGATISLYESIRRFQEEQQNLYESIQKFQKDQQEEDDHSYLAQDISDILDSVVFDLAAHCESINREVALTQENINVLSDVFHSIFLQKTNDFEYQTEYDAYLLTELTDELMKRGFSLIFVNFAGVTSPVLTL